MKYARALVAYLVGLAIIAAGLWLAIPATDAAAQEGLSLPEAQMAGVVDSIDPRLAALGVYVEPAADCSAGCFRLVALGYEDDQQSGGRHQIFGNATGGDGRWTVVWPGGSQVYRPGENHGMYRGTPPNWGGCYNWPTVMGGPFTAYAGTDPARSDKVVGMGLPQCAHVAFYPAWQRVDGPAPTVPPATPRPPSTPVEPPPGYPAPGTPAPTLVPGELPAPAPVIWVGGALFVCDKALPSEAEAGTLLLRCHQYGAP